MATGWTGAYRAARVSSGNALTERNTHDEHNAVTGIPDWGRAQAPALMSVADISRTPLGRAMLHVACLCFHPAAARFFFTGLTRNLREWQHYRADRR